jgi:hypothetical protein
MKHQKEGASAPARADSAERFAGGYCEPDWSPSRRACRSGPVDIASRDARGAPKCGSSRGIDLYGEQTRGSLPWARATGTRGLAGLRDWFGGSMREESEFRGNMHSPIKDGVTHPANPCNPAWWKRTYWIVVT